MVPFWFFQKPFLLSKPSYQQQKLIAKPTIDSISLNPLIPLSGESMNIEINLTNLIKKNLSLLKGNAIRKEISLSADFNADAYVFADEDMLNSTVQNIISNSIKFTPRGGEIKVMTEIIPFFDEATHVKVTIEDNGIGISRNELQKILSQEIISTPGTEREYGTGLGLLIVKEFVEKNGGKIDVKSKINQGTSFSFTLPVSEHS